MECVILGLESKVLYTFVSALGVELKRGEVLIVAKAREAELLRSYRKVLVKVGETTKASLRGRSWEKAPAEIKKPEVKEQAPKANKSLAGKKKAKNKKV